MMLAPRFEPLDIPGPQGRLETLYLPSAMPAPVRGVALIAHPNPLQGGTFTNKIVQTLAKTLSRRGYACYCPNLRGVGHSAGTHDHGRGEVDDMLAVLAHARGTHGDLPLVLAGFSFGSFVQAQVRTRVAAERLILVGPAVGKYAYPDVPADTLVLHGELDDVAPLADVLDWARPSGLPVTVVPGAGHFFHGKLTVLADWVNRLWPQ
jgi:alpha/beta superfamily hydrolase